MITGKQKQRDEIALPTEGFYDEPDTPFNPLEARSECLA